jgi:peptidoglycan/LPS O-acetylase OafA/YrhL
LNKLYIPAVDGMRALAIGIVIVSHFGADRFVPGGFGVTLFFFISGYLITGLLIQEDAAVGKVAITTFYIRRFLRLGPALIVMISIVSMVYFLLVGPVAWPQVLAGIFYYTNYYGLSGASAPMPIWPLWSLAVEEHYYLVYPLAFAIAWKWPGRFLAGLVALTIAVLLWRTALVLHWHAPTDRTYMATDTRIDSILYGAILAVTLKIHGANAPRYFGHWTVVCASGLLLLISFLYRDPSFRETFRYSIQGIAILPLFYAILFVPTYSIVRALLEGPVIVWIGRLSYSLYLYHFPVIFFVPKFLPNASYASLVAVEFVATLAIASCSYYVVEKPFQRLRDRFRKVGQDPTQNVLTAPSPAIADLG